MIITQARTMGKRIEALKTAGFEDLWMLREAAEALEDPSELAELFDLDKSILNHPPARVELSDIQGLGKTYTDLLRVVGISTTDELRSCNPFDLHAAIKVAALEHFVGRVPNRATVEDWIEQAQALQLDYEKSSLYWAELEKWFTPGARVL